ncbi:uncharacterized protein LOC128385930 isoform X2 [Panonychus citri]|uniref:uncharacterized protein LOC128385930 isoform X2 n=1 Tax=Panonychus citri TaxID=50023 RepID=UPI0023082826|nr:uncharacterized protein LOC128385930 isoform X2 [Panonychus citri]
MFKSFYSSSSNRNSFLSRSQSTIEEKPEPLDLDLIDSQLFSSKPSLPYRYSNYYSGNYNRSKPQTAMRSVSLLDWPPSQYIVDTGEPPPPPPSQQQQPGPTSSSSSSSLTKIYSTNDTINRLPSNHNLYVQKNLSNQINDNHHNNNSHHHHNHNHQSHQQISSLNLESYETISNNCDSDSNCSCYNKLGDIDEDSISPIQEEFIQVNVFIPEYLVEQTVSLSEYETIWNLKLDIIDRLSAFRNNLNSSQNYINNLLITGSGYNNHLANEGGGKSNLINSNSKSSLLSASLSTLTSSLSNINNNNLQFNNNNKLSQGERIDLNYGFYCHNLGGFLEEEATFYDYLKGDLRGGCGSGFIGSEAILSSSSSINRSTSGGGAIVGASGVIDCCFSSRTLVRLEFRHKQRIDIIVMSTTLPTSTATRRKRKRGRLIEAVTNGNVEKIIKLLTNCDPNFIDETGAGGETLLSLVAGNATLSTSTSQRVIVALVNGGALLDFRTKDGRTPLHVAVQKSNYVALKTFLDLGASPNYRDAAGLTPLFYSILYSANPKLTQLLLHEHSIHGVADAQGWQEVHHSCKLGLVAHLEQLLYYGCDMNCKIVGSGNTPLHVAAINDQMDCARVLLLRGCNTQIANNSHQTAYQVAVIAGNMNLAEFISNHKPENVVPYRDKPKYNPARRPPSSMAVIANETVSGRDQGNHHGKSSCSSSSGSLMMKDEFTKKYLNGSGSSSSQGGGGSGSSSSYGPSISPCPSQRSCTTSTTISTTTTSSGVCCELDGSQSEEAGDDEGESEDDSTTNTEKSSQHSRVEGRREQKLLGIGSSTTLPSRGRREQHQPNQQKSQQQQQQLMSSSLSRQSVPSNEEISISSILPADMPPITSYDEKTVSLHKGSKGFGFVLRGAKATSPVVKQIHEVAPQPQPISLQYLDEIETGGVAEAAGLKRGDFLLNVNGVDVRSAPHEHVVQLIRQSGDKVTMTVASPNYLTLDDETNNSNESTEDKITHDDKCNNNYYSEKEFSSTMPRGAETRESRSTSKVRNPPVPPKRDPSTTLSISRARAKSLCITSSTSSDTVNNGLSMSTSTSSEMSGQQKSSHDHEDRSNKSSSPSTSVESMVCQSNTVTLRSKESNGHKIASIRSRSSRRISAFELEKFFARQDGPNGEAYLLNEGDDKGKSGHQVTTLQALKKKRNKKLQKDFHSTPDIQEQLALEQAKLALQQSTNVNLKIKFDVNGNRLSTSQEDIRSIQPIFSETLTLRNGKIVHDKNDSSDNKIRPPAPNQPPPPTPSSSMVEEATGQSVMVKVDVSGNRVSKSDYANFAQINKDEAGGVSPNEQAASSAPLSSFKPSLPLSGETESPETSRKGMNYASPDKLQQQSTASTGQQLSSTNKQPCNTLRPAKHVKQSSLVNSGGLESVNGGEPYIPEPDYSSSEDDANTPTNVSGRDLSTFKGTTISQQTKSNNNRMASSYHESVAGCKQESDLMSSSTSVIENDRDLDNQLRNKMAAIAVEGKSVLEMRSGQVEEIRIIKSTKKEERGTISEPLMAKPKGDHFNKVKESIAVFERRSSLTGEGAGTTAAIAAVQASSTSTKSNNTNAVDQSAINNNNALRVSKSCFEVDVCDNNGSSGVSEIDRDNYQHLQQLKSGANVNTRNQQIHSLNRRNSAISTIIRTNNNQEMKPILMYQDKEQFQVPRRASIASTCPTDKDHTVINNLNCEMHSQSTGSAKAAPTMAKTWSEISSAIRAAKGGGSTPVSLPVGGSTTTGTSKSGVLINSGSNLTTIKQTTMRPTSAPSAVINQNNIHAKTGQSNKTTAKSRDGLSAVNEVDVLAELVPPPPEFAAPPPQPMDSRPGAVKIQVGGPKQQQQQQIQHQHHQHMQSIQNHPQMLTAQQQQQLHQQLHHHHQQQLQQQHQHHGQQTHSKMVTTLPATPGAPVNTIISGVAIKGGQAIQLQHQQLINNQRKEDIRLINPQQSAQVHIIHKPTPQQQACLYNNLACEANQQQLIRKSSTPPPPPPPEFSDLSAASRLGVVAAHLPTGHPQHHHTIHLPHHHHHHHHQQQQQQQQPQSQQQQPQQQAKIQYAMYPENQSKQPQQYQSYLQHQQPHGQQFVTLTRYVGKQGQIITTRHRLNNNGTNSVGNSNQSDHSSTSPSSTMSRSVGSESPLTVACSGMDNVVYKVNAQGVLEPIGHHHSTTGSTNYHQFATLSRGRPQQLRVASPSPSTGSASYSDYTRLTVQNRLLRQQQQQQQQLVNQQQGQQQSAQQQQQSQQQLIYQANNQGQPMIATHQYYTSDLQKQQQLHQQLQQQQQLQHQHALQQQQQLHQHQLITTNQGNGPLANQLIVTSNYAQSQPKQPAHPPPPGPPPSLQKHPATFPRRSMVDWSEEDVCDWIASIGMIDHRSKFEFINGVKLLRLDNNDLIGIGVRPSQHRCFILEKIKQHLHYQQQHPPVQ